MTYKIGTRGSLLAVTQSTLIMQQLAALSGEQFELCLIKTQGDQITDKPLWQLEGKDFFTKELDEALLSGSVDMVVHSYKDLGSDRPQGIELGAITERKFAHDILLIAKTTAEQLATWQGPFIVGTSSPRRITNLTKDLASFLPVPTTTKIQCETLRGNVNTRIQKLRDGQYHAITLALAGLDRLASYPESHETLKALLDGLTFAILPLSVFPSAAAQGALALELASKRNDHGKLKSIINKLHHNLTAEEVKREREAFKSYGGGCHLAVGIHVRGFENDFLHFHRGETDGKIIQVKHREGIHQIGQKPSVVFLGQGEAADCLIDELYHKKSTDKLAPVKGRHVFVTTSHVLPSLTSGAQTLWAAGPETRRKMVKAGHWVHGGADSMGHQEIEKLTSSKALQLMMGQAPWLVLSHSNAQSPLGEVFAGYQQTMQIPSEEQKQKLSQVSHAWWASFPQYLAYTEHIPALKNAQHFCGLGKTLQEFHRQGLQATGLTDSAEFLQLIRSSK